MNLLEATVQVSTPRGKKTITNLEALFHAMLKHAVKGDMRGAKLLIDAYKVAKATIAASEPADMGLTAPEEELLKGLLHGLGLNSFDDFGELGPKPS